jgi:D-alanyl-D-alanine carboxypeptidase (penicillin-binding protein 5/6)
MRLLAFLLATLLAFAVHAQSLPQPPDVAARNWLLLDYASGRPLAASGANERVEPASLTKLMTAYLTFAALSDGRLQPDQTVPVQDRYRTVPGSRMFIDPRLPVTVDQLVHGMIVQSGNDASIALAEAVAGTEAAFVARMNQEAAHLGMSGTHFANATGLPNPKHYSTARDLAVLTQALVRDFPQYYPIYATKEYTYNRIAQPNRNRLLWLDPTVDGVKTGHTETAGYCLVASAKRGSRRLIAVVLGTASDGARAQEALKLLNYGFQYFDAVRLYAKGQAVSRLKVYKGATASVVAGFADDFTLSLPKGTADKLRVQLVSRQPLLAPVVKGQTVATLRLFVADKPWGEFPVVALEDVPVAGLFGRAWDSLLLYFR